MPLQIHANSLFNMSKIEDFFRACTLSLPVTFLTGDQVHKSDLTKSLLPLCQIEIWVRD